MDLVQKPGTLLAIEPSGEAAAAGTTLATDMHALMGGVKSAFISSPLRCPVVKSLALTDPADGAAWMPDFRRYVGVNEGKAIGATCLGAKGVVMRVFKWYWRVPHWGSYRVLWSAFRCLKKGATIC